MTQYLGDTSALSRIDHEPVRDRLGPMIERGLVSICDATEFELMYSARSLTEHDRLKQRLLPSFPWVPMGDNSWDEVLALQHELTAKGKHRCTSLVDALVCVIAARSGLTILHYDRDFETIAEVTGQPTEWVVPPGTV